MVWCMKNGVIWNTRGADALESKWMWELKKVSRATKIVEDEFDEHGRPNLKIVYLDAGDWTIKYNSKNDYYYNFITALEKKTMAKINKAKEEEVDDEEYVVVEQESPLKEDDDDDLDGYVVVEQETPLRRFRPRRRRRDPRLIFVTQDRDYWPGSDNDPEAMERRAIKEKAFSELGMGRGPSGLGFDYKAIVVPRGGDDDQSKYHSSVIDDADEPYIRYFDPSLPGSKFIRQNMHKMDLKHKFPHLEAVAKKLGWSWP